MDFCQLLHKAQKNDQANPNGARYYSTKFEPPKKMKKDTKDISDNIKKFLAKKEAEEQKKREEEKRKKEELLALRAQDKKATRRVNVMLKRTKSANQSVIEDAVDNTHTAVTRAGPEQPDEDDYGYVSQEASAYYEKMMEKYSQLPEEPKFNLFKKKVSTNLNSTKDRVKAALEKEREEAMQPHKRKRKKKHDDKNEEGKEDADNDDHSPKLKEEEESKDVPKPKPKPRPAAPPPMSFSDLLKIAAKKQHEPILIEEKPQEEERLYTKRQKKELEREREWKERRERRHMELENRAIEKERGSKMNGSESSSILEKELSKSLSKDSAKPMDRDKISSKQVKFSIPKTNGNDSFKKPLPVEKTSKPSGVMKSEDIRQSKTLNSSDSRLHGSSKNISSKTNDGKSTVSSKSVSSSNPKEPRKDMLPKKGEVPQVGSSKLSGKPKEFPPRDLVPKGKPKEFPPRDLKPKQFPPPDVRGVKRKQPLVANRGRIIDDDDDEDEYDSELDDFIDDEPEEGNYSSYIKEIFGYDKSKYRDLDDDVDNMESSFAQQMKEEVRSAKIGIMEDLEDMKKEEEEKRRKALMKKKMRR